MRGSTLALQPSDIEVDLDFADDLNLHIEKPAVGRYSTVFQTEVVTIMQAATKVFGRNVVNKIIRISSDSKIALHFVGGHKTTTCVVLQF